MNQRILSNVVTGARTSVLAAFILPAHIAAIQGQVFDESDFVELRSGGNTALVTYEWALPGEVPVSTPAPVLEFDLIFATRESQQPDVFNDAVTLTLRDTAGNSTAIYVTLDVTGPSWAPVSEGAIAMSATSFQISDHPAPDGAASFPTQFAYSVIAPIPQEFAGRSAVLFVDLFDNANGVESAAWVGNVAAVPEVREWMAFTAVGLAAFAAWRRRRIKEPVRALAPTQQVRHAAPSV